MLLERNIEDPAGKCGVAAQPSYPIAGPQPLHHPTPEPTFSPTSTSQPKNYERPVDGSCHSDEFDGAIPDVIGSMCFPKCQRQWIIFEVCPEAPNGFNAVAECLLKVPDGPMLCALVCDVDDPESCKPDEGCHCRPIDGIGLCTYDDI